MITFIEQYLDTEGIYRVPGSNARVDVLFEKFDLDPEVDILALNIDVHDAATALKDFFTKRFPPIVEDDLMSELETILCKSNVRPKLL